MDNFMRMFVSTDRIFEYGRAATKPLFTMRQCGVIRENNPTPPYILERRCSLGISNQTQDARNEMTLCNTTGDEHN